MVFNRPTAWSTAVQEVQIRSYVDGCNAALCSYPIGYEPTGFWFVDEYIAQFGGLP